MAGAWCSDLSVALHMSSLAVKRFTAVLFVRSLVCLDRREGIANKCELTTITASLSTQLQAVANRASFFQLHDMHVATS